ncbi:shikimate kinase [Leptolyngbya sp. FACHB-16]|uniref:shikimate kinase n=3 Tax=Leptolyngbya TaxID=47251 RepID=UPI001F550563|nr:shikimate kinase [Leptolyngbya sp. FACHB-16]
MEAHPRDRPTATHLSSFKGTHTMTDIYGYPPDLAARLKGTNIFLVGMMGSGKTTVGQFLAKNLNYRFIDTDSLVEQVAQKPINEIFAESGEDAFRQLETQVLSEVASYSRMVVATGGGIVLARQNWSFLHHGLVVWLDVPVEHLCRRLQADTSRPLLKDVDLKNKLEKLLEERRSLYSQADVRVVLQGDEPPEWVSERVQTDMSKVLNPEDSAINN